MIVLRSPPCRAVPAGPSSLQRLRLRGLGWQYRVWGIRGDAVGGLKLRAYRTRARDACLSFSRLSVASITNELTMGVTILRLVAWLQIEAI